MPKVLSPRGLGFLRLDLSGERVKDSTVEEPLDTLVTIVLMDATLPEPLRIPAYGFPEASVTETPKK